MRWLLALLLCLNWTLGLADGVSLSSPVGSHGGAGRLRKANAVVSRMEPATAIDEESEGDSEPEVPQDSSDDADSTAEDSEAQGSSASASDDDEEDASDEESDESTAQAQPEETVVLPSEQKAAHVPAASETQVPGTGMMRSEARNRNQPVKNADVSKAAEAAPSAAAAPTAPSPPHRLLGAGTFDLAEIAEARLRGSQCPSGTFTRNVFVYEPSMCVYPSGGSVQYQGQACGPANTLVQWISAKASPPYGGLPTSIGAAICTWTWATHMEGVALGGSCGVPPTIAGASNLPMTCTRYNEVAATPDLTPTVSTADVDIVINGGFENDYTPWVATYSTNSATELPIAGWTGGGASMIRSGTNKAACWAQAPEGTVFLQLGSFGSYVTQTIRVTPYVPYTLHFSAWSCAPAQLASGLQIYPQLCVSLDDASTPVLTMNATGNQQLQDQNITFVPETDEIMLSFAVCATNSPVFIDRVSLTVSTEVQNPSFEEDNPKFKSYPSGVIWTSGIGGSLVQQWTVGGNVNLIRSNVDAWGGMPAPDGSTFLGLVQSDLDANASWAVQSFYTIPGKIHVLRFHAVSKPGLLSADLNVFCPDPKTSLLKLCTDCSNHGNTANVLPWAAFNQWTTTFVPSSAFSNVTFSTGSIGAVYIDAISVAPLTMFENSGFESSGGGARDLNFYYGVPPRWTSDSGNVIISRGDTAQGFKAAEGQLFIGLRGNPAGAMPYIKQGLQTCIGCPYTLSIWAQPYDSMNPNIKTALCITVQCQDMTNNSNPVLCGNSTAINEVTTIPVKYYAWSSILYNFVATTTYAVFNFSNCGDPVMENTLFLDGLSVTENY